MFDINKFFRALLKSNPTIRKLILIIIDIFLIHFSLYFAFYFFVFDSSIKIQIFSNQSERLIFILISFFIYFINGHYKGLTRYVSTFDFYKIAIRNSFVTGSLKIITYFNNTSSYNFKSFLIFWIILTSLEIIIRITVKDCISFSRNRLPYKRYIKRIAIYGAGEAGTQLYSIIKTSRSRKVKFFIDDDKSLWSRELDGLQIISPKKIDNLVNTIDEILIAIPSLSRNKIKNLAKNIQRFNKPISCVPALDKISTGEVKIDDLKSIEIEDLLGREPVAVNKEILLSEFYNKSILITGAGGSIGSEICRQLVDLKVKNIILLDHSEFNLYKINEEIYMKNNINVKPILGSVTDKNLLYKIFQENKIDYIFHAAAYKHVPLVESNPLEGIYNNVISTNLICSISSEFKVSKVVLISSDKAVRPTNVMGASKRLAELIFQSYSYKFTSKENSSKENNLKFSLVRFGNVLGSSGSVVPLFKKQILEGGPITLTDKNINRYFMTISEAVQLVLNASYLTKGGEVFLLDMGNPVKILDLAKQMIKLSGLSVKDNDNKDGDIEIICTGLRPGEKLFEELLIDANSIPTSHKRIYSAKENFLLPDKLFPELKILEKALIEKNKKIVFEIMHKLVGEWKQYK